MKLFRKLTKGVYAVMLRCALHDRSMTFQTASIALSVVGAVVVNYQTTDK